jgi:hypothetical protein
MKFSLNRFRFSPRVESLESRMQPGSIFSAASLPASDLSLNLQQDLTQELVSSNQRLVRPASDSSQGLATPHTGMTDAGTIIHVSPVQLNSGNGSTQAQQPATGISLADQALAVNQAHSRSPAPQAASHGHPVSTLGGNVGQQSVSNSPAPVAVQPLQVAQHMTAQLGQTYAAHQVSNLHLITKHTDQIGIQTSSPNWASFLGTPAEDRLEGIGLDNSQGGLPNIVVAGWTGTAGSRTLLIASFSNDGTSATVGTLDLSGAFSNVEGKTVDVDTDGTIYVSASTTDLTGAQGVTILQISQDLSTVENGLTFNGAASAAAGGVKLDGQGNLFASGTIDGNVFITEMTVPDLSVTYAFTLNFGMPTSGQDVVADPTGLAYMATTFIDPSGNALPGIAQFDGSAGMGVAYTSSGPDSFSYGVSLDSSNNPYLAFNFKTDPFSVSNLQVSRFDSLLNQTGALALTFSTVNSYAYGLQVDQGGPFVANAYVSRVGGDVSSGGGNMGYTKINVDTGFFEDQGTAYGDNDDVGRHLVLDAANANIELAGSTNSPIFKSGTGSPSDPDIGAGHFQPANAGGYDGILVQYGNV